MLILTVEVPDGRDRTAIATLRDRGRILATDHAAASASFAAAAALGNPKCDPLRRGGHPPLGRYRLAFHQPTPREQQQEYGAQLMLFEPESGPALEAEAFGRLALLVYGGRPGRDKQLRRTQGGLRLSDTLLRDLIGRLKSGTEVQLDLVAARATPWWQFWKREGLATRPLSATGPAALAPPLDELSLVAMLLPKAPRRVPRATAGSGYEASERNSRSSPGSDSGSGGETFQGRGGAGGGAGASGTWSGPTGAPGVDGAGRIAGGAVAAGVIAGAGVAAMTGDAPAAVRLDGDSALDASANTATDTAY